MTLIPTQVSVLDDAFDDSTVGTPIAFVEEKGEKGPQASTVRVLRAPLRCALKETQ